MEKFTRAVYKAQQWVETHSSDEIAEAIQSYFPDTDVMYLVGYTVDRPHTGEEWGIVGTEIVRYDNWSKSRKVRWRVILPYNPTTDPIVIIKAMDVVGDRVFAVTSRTVEVYVYDTETRATVTTLSRLPRGGRREWLD